LRADDERLIRALHQNYDVDLCKIDMEALRDLSSNLRSWNWRACAIVRESELIALTPLPCRHFGMAVDLGTTKIAGFLIDLETGKTEAVKGVMNPQITYGEDVITRIHFALKSKRNANLLREVVLKAINQMAADLSADAGIQGEEIIEAVVVGNTVMHHLLLGLSVDPLARSPHVPAVQCALDLKVRESGISISPGGYVHLLPNIAGFVGADHVAMLLSTGIYKMKGKFLALDIGTNTEISLVNNGEMTCVSCASGPAFEGGHIKCGMRAASGAIEHLYFSDQKVEFFTIDGAKPAGICGSGILDAMAQLYLAGILDTDGRMIENHPNVHSYETRREFVLVSEDTQCGRPAITITQKDIRELQLAKAAISAGIQALLDQAGLSESDIDRVIVAGAFGSYLNISSAVTIGMLPNLPLDRFQQVGNAAGAGARSVLISLNERKKAEHIAGHIRYFELANLPEFGKLFLKAISLG
ncbi:MAG: ASKHA domain-containing protein, partial [Thermodesulfobacteriota bacterium]|nr:ASKHA domain-containing protein [Thermodesulfobacteriota bacterium]